MYARLRWFCCKSFPPLTTGILLFPVPTPFRSGRSYPQCSLHSRQGCPLSIPTNPGHWRWARGRNGGREGRVSLSLLGRERGEREHQPRSSSFSCWHLLRCHQQTQVGKINEDRSVVSYVGATNQRTNGTRERDSDNNRSRRAFIRVEEREYTHCFFCNAVIST